MTNKLGHDPYGTRKLSPAQQWRHGQGLAQTSRPRRRRCRATRKVRSGYDGNARGARGSWGRVTGGGGDHEQHNRTRMGKIGLRCRSAVSYRCRLAPDRIQEHRNGSRNQS
jgi:hypothetical protein